MGESSFLRTMREFHAPLKSDSYDFLKGIAVVYAAKASFCGFFPGTSLGISFVKWGIRGQTEGTVTFRP